MSTHCRSASSPLLVAAVFPHFPKTPTEAQILQPKKNFQKQRDFLLTFRVFSQHDSPQPRWELLMPHCPGMLHLQGTTGLTNSPVYFSNREKFKGWDNLVNDCKTTFNPLFLIWQLLVSYLAKRKKYIFASLQFFNEHLFPAPLQLASLQVPNSIYHSCRLQITLQERLWAVAHSSFAAAAQGGGLSSFMDEHIQAFSTEPPYPKSHVRQVAEPGLQPWTGAEPAKLFPHRGAAPWCSGSHLYRTRSGNCFHPGALSPGRALTLGSWPSWYCQTCLSWWLTGTAGRLSCRKRVS